MFPNLGHEKYIDKDGMVKKSKYIMSILFVT
jgi:hypothetical protein